MNDFNNSSQKDVNDMPLADLLGMSGTEERVEERDDEPGSGIARLAQMVASSSVAEAKMPSIAPPGSLPPSGSSIPPAGSVPPGSAVPSMGSIPPPGSVPPAGSVPAPASQPPRGSIPPIGQMTGSIPPPGGPVIPSSIPPSETVASPMMSQPAFQAQQRGASSKILIGGAVGVVVIIAGVLVLAFGSKKEENPDQVAAALEAKLMKAIQEKQSLLAKEAEKASQEQDLEEQKAAPTEEPQKAAEDEPKNEVKAEKAEAMMEFTEKKEKPSPRKRSSGGGKKGGGKSAKSKASAPKASATSKEKKSGSGDKSELSDLLATGGSKKESGGESKLPKRPSKAEVKSAMRPVIERASKCSKYSKGNVNLRIIVASNGRVKQVTSTGGSASAIAANCVTMMARTAKFPEFSDSSFTINYPVNLK